jgi:hypothetical protein
VFLHGWVRDEWERGGVEVVSKLVLGVWVVLVMRVEGRVFVAHLYVSCGWCDIFARR